MSHLKTFAVALFGTVLMVLPVQAKTGKEAKASYIKAGKELMAMINSGKIDEAKAQTLAFTMVDEASAYAQDYAKKDKSSEKLVGLVVKEIPEMKKADFTTLEKQYHDAEKFPTAATGIDLKDEKNEKYTDLFHPIVHPLMTLQALKAKNIKDAKEELSEGIEQIEKAE
jgi:hypothetical protein